MNDTPSVHSIANPNLDTLDTNVNLNVSDNLNSVSTVSTNQATTNSFTTNTSTTFVTLTQTAKQALQELLKHGWIEQTVKPNIYQTLLTHQQAVNMALMPLDLHAKIDGIRGLVFVAVGAMVTDDQHEPRLQKEQETQGSTPEGTIETADISHTQDETTMTQSVSVQEMNEADDAWSHPLVRRQRLTLEQSLLLAILRQRYVEIENQHGIGYDDIRIDLDDLQSRMRVYVGTSGSEGKDDARLRTLLEQLANHGVVSKIDDNDEVSIRPLIAHLANPENLSRLLAQVMVLKQGQSNS